MPRPRRKYTLLLCEGSSDKDALWIELSKLYEIFDPETEIVPRWPKSDGRSHDVTAEEQDSIEKIEGLINKVFISDFLKENRLYPKDINRIIHIVDLDGAYIPDEGIVFEDVDKPIYYGHSIGTQHVDGIRKRNKIKRANLDYLSSQNKIAVYQGDGMASSKKIPYSVYYFSSNLDHYLHGNPNLPGEEKGPMARSFKEKCKGEKNYFVNVFKADVADCTEEYSKSWEYIKEDYNSLAPHSNLGVLINELTQHK